MAVRFVFNTSGDYVAFVQDNNLFTPEAEWLGYIKNGNEVFSKKGEFVGYLTKDDRVVRNRYDQKRFPEFPPFAPFKPFRPFTPFRRLRMPRLPAPYEDVFEEESVAAFQ